MSEIGRVQILVHKLYSNNIRGDNEKRRKICIIAHHRDRPEKFDVMSR